MAQLLVLRPALLRSFGVGVNMAIIAVLGLRITRIRRRRWGHGSAFSLNIQPELGPLVWLCVPLGHYPREALHQGTHVCPPPCAQMAGHKAILWQPHLVDRAKGPCPL